MGGDFSPLFCGEEGGVESLLFSSSFAGTGESFFASGPSLLLLMRRFRFRGSFFVDAVNASINMSLSCRNEAAKTEKYLLIIGFLKNAKIVILVKLHTLVPETN